MNQKNYFLLINVTGGVYYNNSPHKTVKESETHKLQDAIYCSTRDHTNNQTPKQLLKPKQCCTEKNNNDIVVQTLRRKKTLQET